MENRWSDRDAEAVVAQHAKTGVSRDLALRVYSTRLLGADPRLVLHGGGNASVKTRLRDLNGEEVDVLCVKGSGWDMATIEPAGLPAVRLAPMRALRSRAALADEEMVRLQRANLIDPGAPNPSVETLLHAFLPHTFVDHTHASAILSLTDQPDGDDLCRDVFGASVGIVPYIMPGFGLAKAAAEVFERDPRVVGLVLAKHGLFTFGASAQESYARTIDLVSRAEERLTRGRKAVFASVASPPAADLADVAPVVRGACARGLGGGDYTRFVIDFRDSPEIRAYVDGDDLARYGQAGVVTPDHAIRIKNWPLVAPRPQAGRTDVFAQSLRTAVAEYVARYEAYFARNNARCGGTKIMLDPMPRVVLVPGLGLFGLGRSVAEARIAADLAVSTVGVVTDAEAIGRFQALPESDLFDCEYWSLEQAKLGQGRAPPLAGQVAVITGGAGTIGAATGRVFAAAGAAVVLLDIDEAAARAQAAAIGGSAFGLGCNVTQTHSVAAAFAGVVRRFGGVDIVVSNAGAAWQGRIGEVDEAVLRASFEINFFAHQRVAQQAVAVMRAQGTGGALLFNVSKQAVNPGTNFGPYGLPKAATLFLVRQYALDHGADGIRANAVNADRIRSGLLTDAMIEGRAKARGVSAQSYLAGNLLGREVTAEDVAQAFLYHALALRTTGDVTTVDGGNIAAALR